MTKVEKKKHFPKIERDIEMVVSKTTETSYRYRDGSVHAKHVLYTSMYMCIASFLYHSTHHIFCTIDTVPDV